MNDNIYKVGKKVITGLDFSSTRRLNKSLEDALMLQVRYQYAGDIGPQIKAVDEYEALLNIIEMRHPEDDYAIYMSTRLMMDSKLKNEGIYKSVMKIRDIFIKDMMKIGRLKAHKVFSYE